MKNIFQSNIEKSLRILKHGKKTSVPPKMEAILSNGEKLEIYVITKNLLEEDLVIKLLAKWRDKANAWFPTQFKVTLEGTKKWAQEQLINKKDRILFFLRVKGEKEPFGHIGLYRFDYGKKSCEIDNVIRGENSESSKGGMTTGLQILIDWTFKYLSIDNLYLKVFSDNTRAIKLYERLGFSEVNRAPLFKSINNGIVSWVEDDSKKESTDRYFVTMRYGELKKIARNVRGDIILMSLGAKSAHTGGALSCVEILVALYFKIMRVFPKDPENPERDRLIFSKAHDGKALYAVLAERGFFNKKILDGYELDGGKLPGHSTRHCVSGIEVSAGALGHGLSMAAGMAYVGKQDNKKFRVFALLSDGECDEGSTWEAILFAGHHRLDNLVTIVDYNKLQGYGFTKDVLDLEPFAAKFGSFGWEVKEIDGHNFNEIIGILSKLPLKTGKPSVIIAHTIKGLGGVPAHINQVSSQYKPPSEEEAHEVIKKLNIE